MIKGVGKDLQPKTYFSLVCRRWPRQTSWWWPGRWRLSTTWCPPTQGSGNNNNNYLLKHVCQDLTWNHQIS